MQVFIRENKTDGGKARDVDLAFNGGSVNGYSLKTDLNAVVSPTTWTIEGVDFSRDWTIAGVLNVSGPDTCDNDEHTKIEIMVGCKKQPQ